MAQSGQESPQGMSFNDASRISNIQYSKKVKEDENVAIGFVNEDANHDLWEGSFTRRGRKPVTISW